MEIKKLVASSICRLPAQSLRKYGTVIIFIVQLAATANAQTQVYHPFPEDTATWTTDMYNSFCLGYCGSNYYQMAGDTLINGQLYNKLFFSYGQFYYITPPLFPQPGVVGTNFQQCHYTGAIRQDIAGKKVYFIDSTMTSDTLLYDFSIGIGDSISTWYSRTYPPYPLIVNSFDSILVDGNYRKRFHFQNIPFTPNRCLVEVIGWTGDLLYGVSDNPDGAVNLVCFNGINSFGSGVAYLDECQALLDCIQLSSNSEAPKSATAKVSPNPCTDKVDIRIENKNSAEVLIYDSTMKLKYSESFTDYIQIDTRNFTRGIYFYRITGNFETPLIGKIIKQ